MAVVAAAPQATLRVQGALVPSIENLEGLSSGEKRLSLRRGGVPWRDGARINGVAGLLTISLTAWTVLGS